VRPADHALELPGTPALWSRLLLRSVQWAVLVPLVPLFAVLVLSGLVASIGRVVWRVVRS
jgi:hypothetical protein